MRRLIFALLVMAMAAPAFAASLGSATRTVIPADVQQIISVDYRRLNASDTAKQLEAKVLPPDLKQFETALRGIGIVPEKDVDQLTFTTFRKDKNLKLLGIAQGVFSTKKISKKLIAQKIKPTRYRRAQIWPMASGMSMTFLDENTMVFGPMDSVKDALDVRDGEAQSLESNDAMSGMISGVDSGTVWSILDALGTQNMLRSAMGDASKLADYDAVKKRVKGSRYLMDFSNGVAFDLDVLTDDNTTAAMLTSLMKAGMMYRKYTASPIEKTALEDMTVDNDSDILKVHYRSSDDKFRSLLNSELFAAVIK